jgi:hypothetical protein
MTSLRDLQVTGSIEPAYFEPGTSLKLRRPKTLWR